MSRPFPSARMRLVLAVYGALWTVLLPLVLLYLRRRGQRDPDYGGHLAERFGRYPDPVPGAVWVHAVSLGEVRSAVPLIRALLDRGERIVTTHFTPAGRREAEAVFAAEIAADQLRAVWVPFEFSWAYARFFASFRPRCGLVMEIEVWPRMIAASRRHGVPLFMCNAQYPSNSMARDARGLGLRAELMTGFAGALVKSDLQARRFASVGVGTIAVTGELRFDQPVPEGLVARGLAARAWLAPDRPVVAFASVVAGEDAHFIEAARQTREAHRAAGLAPPLVVYIPRKPERFAEVGRMLAEAGLVTGARSALFDAGFQPQGRAPALDVLLGDSLGEMYGYLAMADRVVVGGGFTSGGSHNISEALALTKPVMVGPAIHTIEYPAVEAIEAGVCRQLADAAALTAALSPGHPPDPDPARIAAFVAAHSGAATRTLEALDRMTAR